MLVEVPLVHLYCNWHAASGTSYARVWRAVSIALPVQHCLERPVGAGLGVLNRVQCLGQVAEPEVRNIRTAAQQCRLTTACED